MGIVIIFDLYLKLIKNILYYKRNQNSKLLYILFPPSLNIFKTKPAIEIVNVFVQG